MPATRNAVGRAAGSRCGARHGSRSAQIPLASRTNPRVERRSPPPPQLTHPVPASTISPHQAAPTLNLVCTCPLRARQGTATEAFGTLRACPAPQPASGASTPALVLALDEHLGPPVDSYLNGSQTWLTDDGPGGVGLEWRLHPVAGYRLPRELSHYDLWEQVVGALSAGDRSRRADARIRAAHPAVGVGRARVLRRVRRRPRAGAARAGRDRRARRPPDAVGLVDHDQIGAAWEQARGATSIVEMLFAELKSTA